MNTEETTTEIHEIIEEVQILVTDTELLVRRVKITRCRKQVVLKIKHNGDPRAMAYAENWLAKRLKRFKLI